MVIARLALAAALLSGGCLRDLERPSSDTGDDGGMGDGGPGPGTPFPDGVGIRRNDVTADLDGDDATDLVLLDGGDDLGVYIVRGGGPDPYLTTYHSFFDTGDCDPVAATVEDFMDDAAVDLLVMCHNGNQGHLLAFAGNGDGTFDEPREHSTGAFIPGGGTVELPEPVFVTTARLRTGGSDIGAVFGGLYQPVYTYLPDDWANEAGQPEPEIVGAAADWDAPDDTPNAAIAVTGDFDGLDDLMVVGNASTLWARREDDETLSFFVDTAETYLDELRVVRFATVSDDGYPDVVTASASALLNVVNITDHQEAEVLTFESGDPIDGWSSDVADSFLALDLDGQDAPEVVILDSDATSFTLYLLDNLITSGGMVRRSSNTAAPLVAFTDQATPAPDHIIGGDFDDDGSAEVWVFDAALAARACFHACDDGAALAVAACDDPCE